MMTDCTAVGDEVVIMIMMMLSMAMMCILSFLRLVDCCTLYGGWVGSGLGWVSYLVGWVESGSMIWTHGQLCRIQSVYQV